MKELTEEELELLDFEGQWWRHGGAKEEAIRERFGTGGSRCTPRHRLAAAAGRCAQAPSPRRTTSAHL